MKHMLLAVFGSLLALTAAEGWQGFGTGANDRVTCLFHDEANGRLYIAGDFDRIGDAPMYHAAVWNGTTWADVGAIFGSTPMAMLHHGGSLYLAAGTIGDSSTSTVYVLSSGAWQPYGQGAFSGLVKSLAASGGTIYAAGYFSSVGGRVANNIAACSSGGPWNGVGEGVNGDCLAVDVLPSGAVVAGGTFTSAGGVPANRLAVYASGAWSAFGTGANGPVWSVKSYGSADYPIVVAAGEFTEINGVPATAVAQCAGGSWAPLGSFPAATAYKLHMKSGGSIAATTASGVAIWNGSGWTSRTLNGRVYDVWYDSDGDLYAGGVFSNAGGTLCNRIARWDPTPPSASVSTVVSQAAEGGASASFRVSISAVEDADVMVGITYGGTANHTDFAAMPTTVIIPAGSTSTLVGLAPVDDAVLEVTETVTATISGSGGGYSVGSPSVADMSIADNDASGLPEVSLSVPDAEATEGGDGASFTIALAAPAAAPITVHYSVSGTAVNGTDYATLSGVANIPGGSSSATIQVSPINDAALEGAETVYISLDADSAYVLGGVSVCRATIADDEAVGVVPKVSIVAVSADIFEGTTSNLAFTVSIDVPQTQNLTVNIRCSGGVSYPQDYRGVGQFVIIAAGDTSTNINLDAVDDGLAEGRERLDVTILSGSGYAVQSPAEATVWISDPIPKPTLAMTQTTSYLEEGQTINFTLTLSRPTTIPIVVSLDQWTDTAADCEFENPVTIPVGDTQKVVVFRAVVDGAAEGSEGVGISILPSADFTTNGYTTVNFFISDPSPPAPVTPPASSDAGGGGGGGCGSGGLAAFVLGTLALGLRGKRRS